MKIKDFLKTNVFFLKKYLLNLILSNVFKSFCGLKVSIKLNNALNSRNL